MAGPAAELTRLLNAVLAQVRKLNDDQASALVDGSAELRYVPKTLVRQFNQLAKLSDEQLQQIAEGEAEYKLVPKTLVTSYNKLARLSEEQLLQLANGEAEFKLVSKNAGTSGAKAPKTPPPSAFQVREAMLSAPDQASAREFFKTHKLKAAEIKTITSELDLPVAAKADTNIDTIIKVFVTGRLTTSAVRF